MPKHKRAEAARKGWKKRNSQEGNVYEKRHKWDDRSMVEAMEVVKSGRLGVNRATNEYNVPKTTLKDRISGRVKHGSNPGRQPYLTSSKENELENFLIEVCKMGHGKTKREVIDIVRRTVEKKMKKEGKDFEKCDFKGEGWWQGFTQRYPNISLRISDALSRC